MANLVKRFFKVSTLLCLILALSGCALCLGVIPAAVSGGSAGVEYTFTNSAYKTISAPVADVEAALHRALKKMSVKETKRKAKEDKVSVTGVAGNLDIYIDLEKVTATVTKIEVKAKKGVFFKDKSTATEIIVQTEENLEVKK
jgi:hypothetical protein